MTRQLAWLLCYTHFAASQFCEVFLFGGLTFVCKTYLHVRYFTLYHAHFLTWQAGKDAVISISNNKVLKLGIIIDDELLRVAGNMDVMLVVFVCFLLILVLIELAFILFRCGSFPQ